MAIKKNYYCVKVGRKTGIFKTWAECQKQTIGFKGAIFKGFVTLAEAEEYMGDGEGLGNGEPSCDVGVGYPVAYVDGSFDLKSFTYSYGVVLLLPDGELLEFNGKGTDKEAAKQRNVAGEVLGAMVAIEEVVKLGYNEILIKHDYMGISAWAKKEWKANTHASINYVGFIDKYSKDIKIRFEKVDAHTGVIYNERADQLAKDAIKA